MTAEPVVSQQGNDESAMIQLDHACRAGDYVTIDKVLASNNIDPNMRLLHGNRFLMIAVSSGRVEAVSTLIKHGADPNIIDDADGSALSHAARRGYVHVAKKLLEEGSDVNLPGTSVLADAALYRELQALKLLIVAGADVDRPDRLGNTALHNSVRVDDYSAAVVLLDSGAKTNIKNRQGQTPLEMAQQFKRPAIEAELSKARNASSKS